MPSTVKWITIKANECTLQVNAIRKVCECVLMPDQIIFERNNKWQVWVLLNGNKWQSDCNEQMEINAIVNCIK